MTDPKLTTIDALLNHVYLPRLKEDIGADVKWHTRDGKVLIPYYEALLETVDREYYTYGRIRIEHSALGAPEDQFIRALDKEISGLAREFRRQLR